VRGDPPESLPGASVAYRALVVTPSGTTQAPPIDWAFCASPKPLTENDAVSVACLGGGVRPIAGPAPTVDAPTPIDACSLFGPLAPPGSFRPRDADATGGYYQPVRLEDGALTAFAFERVTCDLPDAPIAVAEELAKLYRPNVNPTLMPLAATVDGAPVELDAVPADRTVALETGWGSRDAERYVMYDPSTGALLDRREALRISWFVTGGALRDDVTGRAEDDVATTTGTTWRSPPSAGPVHLWLVLRDSRGGVDFAAYDLVVE
jgi:hypothetical protein